MHRRLSLWIDYLVNSLTKHYRSTWRLCHLKNLRLWLIGCVSSKSTPCNAGQKAEVSRSSNSSHSAALGTTQLDSDKSEKVHILAQICCLHNVVFCKHAYGVNILVLCFKLMCTARMCIWKPFGSLLRNHICNMNLPCYLFKVKNHWLNVHQAVHLPKSAYNIMVQVVLLSDIQHAPMARSRFYSSKAKELIQQVLKQKLTGVVYDPELAPLLVKEITEDVKMGLKGVVFCTAIFFSNNWCSWDSHYK